MDHSKLWKILKEMGIPDHLTCLLCASQKATVRTSCGKTGRFKTGKGVHQGCILSPCLFDLNAEYIMWNARLDESQAGIKIAGININNLRYTDDTTLMAEWKSWLKTQHSKNNDHGIWSHHFMAERWGNNGNSGRFYFLGLPNHCGQWLQPWN